MNTTLDQDTIDKLKIALEQLEAIKLVIHGMIAPYVREDEYF